jgi:hypothetical protein
LPPILPLLFPIFSSPLPSPSTPHYSAHFSGTKFPSCHYLNWFLEWVGSYTQAS